MALEELSGRELADALVELGYTETGETDDHVVLKYTHPRTDGIRIVTIPVVERLAPTVLENVADQAGAIEFETFRERVENAAGRA